VTNRIFVSLGSHSDSYLAYSTGIFSVLFLNIQCTYLLLAPNRASLPGITACMGCVKKQVTELKQKNVSSSGLFEGCISKFSSACTCCNF
jgi:hypothetical protein